MQSVVRYDFIEDILPHGEDGVSFYYEKGNLLIEIPYDERTKFIRLKFHDCAYHYFSPIPGYCPEQFNVGFSFESSRVYELFNTELLLKSEAIFKNSKYRPNRRHFFLYLEWENVVFHIVAESIQVIEASEA